MKRVSLNITLIGILFTAFVVVGCSSGSESKAQDQHSSSEQNQEHTGSETQKVQQVGLTPKQQEQLGVKVEKLNEGSASSTITRPANIVYNQDKIAKVGPRIEAKVVKVMKGLGDRVEKGEPIAIMSSVELGKAKANYIKLRAQVNTEKARYEREKSLYEQNISSEAELLEAKASYQEAKAEKKAAAEALRLYGLSKKDVENIESGGDQPLSHFALTSPLEGVIQQRDLSPGQTVSSKQTPVHVANIAQLWVMIDAYEQDIPYIQKGQKVNLSVRSIPGETFEGTTDWVSYALDKEARTMPLRAVVQNPNGKLRAGMTGTARIHTNQERGVAMIPVGAVQNIENQKVVFVPANKKNHFKTVPVTVGAENAGYVEIVSGLKPGDKAVISGAFDLKSALTAKTRSASHGH